MIASCWPLPASVLLFMGVYVCTLAFLLWNLYVLRSCPDQEPPLRRLERLAMQAQEGLRRASDPEFRQMVLVAARIAARRHALRFWSRFRTPRAVPAARDPHKMREAEDPDPWSLGSNPGSGDLVGSPSTVSSHGSSSGGLARRRLAPVGGQSPQ